MRDAGDENGWLEGKIARVAPDTVVLAVCSKCRDPERVLTRLSFYDFQRHSGVGSRGGNMKRGALAGAIVGIGAVMYSLSRCKPSDDLCGLVAIAIPPAAAGGAIGGALVVLSSCRAAGRPGFRTASGDHHAAAHREVRTTRGRGALKDVAASGARPTRASSLAS
jgi:hypothetical protein